MGLSLLASKDKGKLVARLTQEAANAVDGYVEADALEVEASDLGQEALPYEVGRGLVHEA